MIKTAPNKPKRYWLISAIGFGAFVICIVFGYRELAWLIIFPATILIRLLVTKTW
jgi:hypothetical protein